jgi:hypothetical protein
MSECIECMHRHLLVLVALLAAGCTTERLYDGEPPPAGQTAIVRADPVVNAGLPVQVRIRRVNGRDVGRHEILVDCRIAETGSVRRFTVAAALEPGRRYRLAAETSARNCEAVQLLDD